VRRAELKATAAACLLWGLLAAGPSPAATAATAASAGVTTAPSAAADSSNPPLTPAERALLAQQPRRVASAVDRMAPRVPGRANVFFVGFAGYGEQRVFRKEEELARRVFGERFGSLDRSVELVNDVHDRTTYPLATFDNLRHALRLIGRRMDRSRDVLVLVLTSHGSSEDGIAITNSDLLDDALSPRDVRQVLAEAGIRWRVIVASACYAGVFIRPLRSDTTLIMTAADSRHSSFGCADDRDLTYFGEALFKDALPGACSLEDAFASARRIIRQRETEEGDIHSNPQIYVGARMRAKLRALDHAAGAGSQNCRQSLAFQASRSAHP
jgi:Peptidase C13 family